MTPLYRVTHHGRTYIVPGPVPVAAWTIGGRIVERIA